MLCLWDISQSWPYFSFSFGSLLSLFPWEKLSSNTWFWTVGVDAKGRYEVRKNPDCQWRHLSRSWFPHWHSCWSCTWVSDIKWRLCSCRHHLCHPSSVKWSVLLTFQTVGWVTFEHCRPLWGRAVTVKSSGNSGLCWMWRIYKDTSCVFSWVQAKNT